MQQKLLSAHPKEEKRIVDRSFSVKVVDRTIMECISQLKKTGEVIKLNLQVATGVLNGYFSLLPFSTKLKLGSLY